MDPNYQQVIVTTIRNIASRLNTVETKLTEGDVVTRSSQPSNTTTSFDIENRFRDLENKMSSVVERKELQDLKASIDSLSVRIASLEQCASKMVTTSATLSPVPFDALSNNTAISTTSNDDDIILNVSQTQSNQVDSNQPIKKRIYRKKT